MVSRGEAHADVITVAATIKTSIVGKCLHRRVHGIGVSIGGVVVVAVVGKCVLLVVFTVVVFLRVRVAQSAEIRSGPTADGLTRRERV